MKMKKLGKDNISVVGYGAWEIGGKDWGANPDEKTMIAAIRAGFDAGINWVDTAEIYGNGRSEEIIGRALKSSDDVMVFTKVAPAPYGSGHDRAAVRKAAEASLKRLGRDVIDLYQLHWPSEDVDLEETWEAMIELADAGLVRHIGVSNFDVSWLEICEKMRHVDSLQPELSMLDREPLEELVPWCAANGTAVLAYGPLAYGLLTGTITAKTKFAKGDWRGGSEDHEKDHLFGPKGRRKNLAIVEALRPIAERKGVTLAQLALAWIFHQEGDTVAIAGSRNAAHVVDNARAGDVKLTAKDLSEIATVLEGR